MSVLDEQGMPRQPLPPAPRIEWTPPPNRRRQILRGLAAVLVLALVGGGIGSLVYIHHYQPLGRAGVSVGGPDDTIANNGHFDVTLIGPGPDSELIYHWAKPWLPNPGGGYRQSSLVDAHPLPATLHAHQSIALCYPKSALKHLERF